MNTSLFAFESIKEYLGEKQFFVLKCLEKFEEGATNLEISSRYGIPINCTTPRIYELRNFGLVYKTLERPCKISGKIASVWKIYNSQEALKNFNLYLKTKKNPIIKKQEVQKSFL